MNFFIDYNLKYTYNPKKISAKEVGKNYFYLITS